MRENVINQLAKLQVDHVDLLLIHWPHDMGKPGFPTHEEAWLQLEALKREGLTKSIGVSNYKLIDLEKTLAVATEPIDVNQIELHPYVYKHSTPLLELMAKNGIIAEAYGPSQPVTKYAGKFSYSLISSSFSNRSILTL